jgi:hypothetical protein
MRDSYGSSSTSSSEVSGFTGDYSKYLNIGLAILAIIILLFLIGSYYNHKKNNKESFEVKTNHIINPIKGSFRPGPEQVDPVQQVKPQQGMGKNEVFQSVNNDDTNNEQHYNNGDHSSHNMGNDSQAHHDNNIGLHGNQYPVDCYPKDTLRAAELLPSDANSKWAKVNPSGQGELGDQNFLEAGFHIGTNTIGQTLRNPNLQLRSEPANPQLKVSPWMQTTIEPDSNRRGLEIGGC